MFQLTRVNAFATSVVLATFCWMQSSQAKTWSNLAQPPTACRTTSMAANASGTVITAGSIESGRGLGDFSVEVCTTTNGVNWSGPEIIGKGVSPSVAVAPDGRVIAVWQGGLAISPDIKASVKQPYGSWSMPVTLAAEPGIPVVAIDIAGNAVAAWAPPNLAKGVSTARRPVYGKWTSPTHLASAGGGVSLATNDVGEVVVAWRTASAIETASGTILDGFDERPVVVGWASGDLASQGVPKVAINGGGAASLVWQAAGNVFAVTRSIDGTWSIPTQLFANGSGVGTAIDGAGNAIAAFGQPRETGVATYICRRPARGAWSDPVLVSTLGDRGLAAVRGDVSGTFIVTWVTAAGAVDALTIAPDGSFQKGALVGNGPFMGLAMVPGAAALRMGSGFATRPVF